MDITFKIIILLLSLIGIVISLSIHGKRKKKEKQICLDGDDCEAVIINSHFNSIFGIKNEIFAYIFYTTIFVIYWLSIFIKIPDNLTFIIILMTALSFFYSLYLTFIQLFIIKRKCILCIFSAILVTLILIISLFGINIFNIFQFLYYYYWIFIVMYSLALAIGLGMSFSYKIIFSKFLQDYKITKTESNTLRTLSKAIFISLGVLLISGFGISLINTNIWDSPIFIVQAIIISVLLIHAFILKFHISPHLISVRFGDKENKNPIQTSYYRKISFAANGISIISWTFLFLLSILYINISLGLLFLIYLFFIVLAIVLSLRKEYKIYREVNN